MILLRSSNKKYKMKKLTIDSTLWDKPTEIISLKNIVYDKISVINDHENYYLKYSNGGFDFLLLILKVFLILKMI